MEDMDIDLKESNKNNNREKLPDSKTISVALLGSPVYDNRVLKEMETLASSGFKVSLISLVKSDSSSSLPEEFNNIKAYYLELSKYNRFRNRVLRIIFNLLLLMTDTFRYTKLLVSQKSNVYHANDLNTLLQCYIAAKINRAKLIYDSHELHKDSVMTLKNSRFIQKYLNMKESFLIRRADGVITVNKTIADILSQHYSIDEPEVVMNCSVKRDVISKNLLRESLDCKKNMKIAIVQGAIKISLALEPLIMAIEPLDDVCLVFLGYDVRPEKERAYLKEIIDGKSMSNRVLFLPAVKPAEVIDWVSGADIGIIPLRNMGKSYYYSSPNKLFDYMMAEIPVLASDFPEIERIVSESQCGYTCDFSDSASIKKGLQLLLSNSEESMKLGANGREKALLKYNWEEQSKRLVQMYFDITKTDRL